MSYKRIKFNKLPVNLKWMETRWVVIQ